MNSGTTNSTNSSMSPSSSGRQAESLRDRFEAALLSAASSEARPRIDDYLRDLPEPERSAVLCSLLAVELRFRIENGEQPNLEEYLDQFPGSANQIKLVFEQTKSGDPAPTSSLAAGGPITRDDAVANPTISYFPGGGMPADTTEGHTAANGAAPPAAQSTEQLKKKTRRHLPTALPFLPGYEVIEVVGRGGMGIVYKARDPKLQRLVALKMIDPQRDHAPGPEDLKRMLAEAQAVAKLGNPSIVAIYAIGEHNGQPYLVLEFLDGGNLSKKLSGVPQPAHAAAALLETLARTIEYAHQKQIVHRDLKPSNILLSANGIVKIADFGLAKRLDQDFGQDEDGFILGTIYYMAPEQAWGKNQQVGNAADIYALGVILYEMLTGRPPFKAARRWDTVQLVRNAEPVPPRRLVPQVPLDLELICLKCLRKDPKERFASAADLADELRRFQEGRPIQTRPTPAWERAWKWAKRQPALAASIVVIFLVSVIALGSLMLHLEQRAERAEAELKMREKIAKDRDDVQTHHRKAQEAFDQGLPKEAQGRLQAGLAIIGTEPALSDLKPEFDALHLKVGGKIVADEIYQKLFAYRDIALFNGMVLSGVDLKANVKATRQACAAAVQLFSDANGSPLFPDYLSAERKAECQAACYELLLVWAEAEAAHGADLHQALGHTERARLFHPATHAYHLRRARLLDLQHRAADASNERQLAARIKPAGALDHFLIGDSFLRQAETLEDARLKQASLRKAGENFALAVTDDPSHFWAWYMLGMCNLQMNDMKLARQDFTTCLGQCKDLWYPYMSRGFANGQLGDFDAAEKDYRHALALLAAKPDRHADYGILVNLGELRLKQARLAQTLVPIPWPAAFLPNLEFACRGAAHVVGEKGLDAAADLLEDARKLQPDGYHAYLYLALVRQAQHRLDEASELFDEAIAKANKQRPFVQAHLYGQRARLQRQRQKLDLALRDLNQAVKLAASAEDHAERGRILFALKEREQAVRAFNKAIDLRPDEPEVYRLKAEALRALKKDKEAAQALELYFASRGRPSAELYRMLGALQAKAGDSPKALKAYTNALEQQPDAATYTARAWVFLANESAPLALADFNEAIQRDSHSAEAYAGRGLIHARQGKLDDARADAERALKRGSPTPSARLLWNIAHVYAQIALRTRGRQRDENENHAVAMLDRALKQVPTAEEKKAFWAEYIAQDALLLVPLRGNVGFDNLESAYGPGAQKPMKQR